MFGFACCCLLFVVCFVLLFVDCCSLRYVRWLSLLIVVVGFAGVWFSLLFVVACLCDCLLLVVACCLLLQVCVACALLCLCLCCLLFVGFPHPRVWCVLFIVGCFVLCDGLLFVV